MSSSTVNFPPLRADGNFLSENRLIHPDAQKALLLLYNGFPLETVDTSGGSANFPVPLSSQNQNVEITFVKISSDGNTPTLTASGSDLINGASSKAMGTAQYSHLKLKSDGDGNWYVVG